MRKTLLQFLTFVLCITGMQNPLLAQEQTPLNQVVNTLKERISLSGYAQLGYTYDDAANPDNTFDIKRIIFMAHGKITKRWTCDFMYDFYNGGMLLEVYTDYQFLPGLTARIGIFRVSYGVSCSADKRTTYGQPFQRINHQITDHIFLTVFVFGIQSLSVHYSYFIL